MLHTIDFWFGVASVLALEFVAIIAIIVSAISKYDNK